ncbi:DNA polymerase III [Flammeovirga sp. MY04]|uniref:exonuclease domain-containing protein n=1 Tax=Flammeovirga sp. MY04 TaxID=1191459 RepID=UPI0008061C42|nr:exonuclease domain-containing protein [Flammeovirga sp. MY04]ANQ48084.1 DNA polymerase III [Flammeovirga sp. MY04]
MGFIAIDFETANDKKTSSCSIGLAVVENQEIVDTQHHLIQPFPNYYFDKNISIHGITPEMTFDAPTFDNVWGDLSSLLTKYPLVAHNAGFDMNVLLSSLQVYGTHLPSISFFCSLVMARKAFPGLPSYGLANLSRHFEIQLNHHNAESDAMASAIICIEMLKEHDCDSLDQLSNKFNHKIGNVSSDNGYSSYGSGRPYKKRKEYGFSAPKNVDPKNRFYKKSVCFTGRLTEMNRKTAMQKVVNIGGYVIPEQISPQTDFLVVGKQDYKKYGEGFKSTKIRHAEAYAEQGFPIFIMGENEFLMSFDD